jgi:hypothetical protein
LKRFAAPLIAGFLGLGLLIPAGFFAPTMVYGAVPKVVIIVGPAGVATDRYRAEAKSAAAVARKYTPDVVELYSPDATWPAATAALKNASLVIYMGHGNGWPSRYRDQLYPITQDGFGLNPVAGGGDDSHQYFGEASVGREVKLAKNAVVLLNHLCYASGNSEPGLPEGTLDQAKQRVDNYAAGFIRAGASAVVAEAWASPNYMVRSILGGSQSVEAAWRDAPSALGNPLAFKSVRSSGFTAEMQTETASSGFGRSLVVKSGLGRSQVLASAQGSPSGAQPVVPTIPTLDRTGLTLGGADIQGLPTAGKAGDLLIPYKLKTGAKQPKGLQASVRWDLIQGVAPAAPSVPDPAPAPDPAAKDPPATSNQPAPPSGDATGTSQDATADTAAAPARAGDDTVDLTAPVPVTTESQAGAGTEAATAPTPKPAASSTTKKSKTPAAKKSTATAAPKSQTKGTSSSKTPTKATPTPTATPDFDAPAARVDLVQAESLGDVVALVPAKFGRKNLTIPVTPPAAPGQYRLTVTLHDSDGVAYDAATQAMLPGLSVRVTGQFDGAVLVDPTASLTAGASVALPVRVANLGTVAWGIPAARGPVSSGDSLPTRPAQVIARWVPLAGGATTPDDATSAEGHADLPIGLAAGATADASVALTVPAAAGEYLLLLDVVTPQRGSLAASGWQPALVRVTVTAAP